MIINVVVIGDKDYINFQIAELNGEIMIMMEAVAVDVLVHLVVQDLVADAHQGHVELAPQHLVDVLPAHALVQQ